MNKETARGNTPSEAGAVLPYLEFHITDSCNLHCKGCSHYCPLIKEPAIYAFDAFQRDMRRMRELYSAITTIRIMGGEPFTHPRWEKYVTITRALFPESAISIVTNGLLVSRLTAAQCNCLLKNRVSVNISWYPPTYKRHDEIVGVLKRAGVAFVAPTARGTFRTPLSLQYAPDKWEYKCPAPGCVNIRDGKIARCAPLLYVHIVNDFFSLQLPDKGIYALHEPSLTGATLSGILEEWPPLCKHCVRHQSAWAPSGPQSKIKLSDWFVDAGDD